MIPHYCMDSCMVDGLLHPETAFVRNNQACSRYREDGKIGSVLARQLIRGLLHPREFGISQPVDQPCSPCPTDLPYSPYMWQMSKVS